MKRMRIIPTTMHGAMDYGVGALLIAAPWIFRFSDSSGAKWTSIIVGAVMSASALMTNYELGMMRVMPMHGHLMGDVVIGAFLAASPWIVGYADEGANAWLPMLVIGILEIRPPAGWAPGPDRTAP